MKTQQAIWFVIVTYEPERETLRRLVAALEGWLVMIVDNTQNQLQTLNFKLQNEKANVAYIHTGKNLGYATAGNQGMKAAFDKGAQWVVVCNQDIALVKAGVGKFANALGRSEPGIIGPEAGTLDPKRWTTILASRPGLEARRLDHGIARYDELSYISGSFMAIHKEVWEATGGFYEPYFMYYEDADLSMRARNAGFPLIVLRLAMRHKEGSNEYYLARNHLLFVERNAPVGVKIHEFLRLTKTLYEYRDRGNRGAWHGVRDYIMRRFGMKKE
ncbi:hypothetical protein A2973_04840 [Candidatus Gottesmanbacteria bacterium RIFCSPLOWO2_01_FULL_49_10]|uniref:Glycosyltransferase 2-like domain-containing protein n=1 Tax=Candidatus Gottesmanbacteria bacterium RIFCSPLOWO2_01_FULL_49_10 TaxID=1798396 RepID=A0A1F6AYZ0_9BACT|nr:MAG: hypothetical protein A2973_04840 [Candidatus Gottesmanbacteria bacterium RIFCSPLOWO2_01_FULL_49_10]